MTTMRSMLTCLVLLISCGGSSPPRVDWPAIVACSGPAQADLLSSVTQLLLDRSTDPSAEFERLAQQHSPQMIACVIDQAVTQLAAVAAAPPAPQARAMAAEPAAPPAIDEQGNADVAAARGRDFLQRVGTTVEGDAK